MKKKGSRHISYHTAMVQLPLMRDTPDTLLRTPAEAVAVCADMADLAQECFHVLILNTRNRLLSRCLVSIGTIDSSLVHARDVFRQAIVENASFIVLVHNHPSGDPTPSAEDIRITKQLCEVGKILGIIVMDHIVLGRKSDLHPSFISMRETGLCDFSAK